MSTRDEKIARAAERFAETIGLRMNDASKGTFAVNVDPETVSPDQASALGFLGAALALPAPPSPEWSKTAPTKPGMWWCRSVETRTPVLAIGSAMEDGRLFFRNLDGERVRESQGVEWWPLPIPEPPK